MSVYEYQEVLVRTLGLEPHEGRGLAQLLDSVGGLGALLHIQELPLGSGLSPQTRQRLQGLLELQQQLLAEHRLPERIEGPEDVLGYFRPRLMHLPRESFWVLGLDARARPRCCYQVALGTLDACLVHPREVFAPALLARAASLILVHNHPSGDPRPSDEDRELNVRLCAAGELLGIPVLDHLVVSRSGYSALGPEGGFCDKPGIPN